MYINIVFKKHNNKKYPKFGRCSKKRKNGKTEKNIHSFCKGFTINRQIFLHVT